MTQDVQRRSPQDDDRAHGQPGDFGGVGVFLGQPRACDYVTGQTIFVDGGCSVS